MTSSRRFASFSVLALLAACACNGSPVLIGRTSTKLAADTAIAMLDLQLVCGSLDVREHAGNDVIVEAEVWASGDLAEAHAGKPVGTLPFAEWIDLGLAASTLRLRSHAVDDDHQLRIQVRVPALAGNAALHVQTGELQVQLPRLGNVDTVVDTGQLSLDLGEVTGTAKARVGTGQLDVTFGKPPQTRTELNVGTGAATLRLPPDAAGAFDLAVDTGGLEGLGKFGLQESRRTVGATARGERGNGGPPFVVRVGTGQITLR